MSTRKRKIGRPTKFTNKLADRICIYIADGGSLNQLCRQHDMPSRSTVHKWLAENKDFSDKYARARDYQADYYADEIIEIADTSGLDIILDDEGNYKVDGEVINRARLRIDARKWISSKLKPKKYGDKLMSKHVTDDGQGGDVPIGNNIEINITKRYVSCEKEN